MNLHLSWQCSCGNIFSTTPNKVIHRNQWCPKCGIIKRAKSQASDIEECRTIAQNRNGKCLSKIYENNSTPLKWICEKGHSWVASFRSIKGSKNRKGTWCPICHGNVPLNIQFAQSVARELGWICLSKEYVNYNGKLDWKCSIGHNFNQSLAKVVARKRCPKCHGFFGEELCRYYFESTFKSKFPKSKPNFLKIKGGVYWELDGYNEKLGIAFEHHGEQHFKFNSRFYRSLSHFKLRKIDEKNKRKLCVKNGVKLIEIPAIPEITTIKALPLLLITEFKKKNIKYKEINFPKFIDFKYISNSSRFDFLKEVALERGGELLSESYNTGRTKLRWQCKENHVWDATPENILGNKAKKGTWCPECADETRNAKNRSTIQDMHELAKLNIGLCLSTKYKNASSKLKWKCKKGHIWDAVPNSVQQGSWCPTCWSLRRGKSKKGL